MTYVMGKRYQRLIPCPDYDFSKIENWLSDMAEEGLILEKDGIFGSLASFKYRGPQKVQYRLEAAQKNARRWDEPDPEQIDISEAYSWEYVDKLRDFYIFRSFDCEARELNTDPEVQALALNAVKKRSRGSLISSMILLLVYPIVLTRGCLLLTTIAMGTWWMVTALILGALIIAGEIRAFVHLKGIQRSLQSEGCYSPEADWKKGKVPLFAKKTAETVLAVLIICLTLRAWGVTVTGKNEIPIDEYDGTIPFATIKDFAGDGYSDYSLTMAGLFGGINTVKERSDLLAPRCMEYNEHAAVRRADGKLIDGGLYVEYCELRSPAAARICARELYRLDRLKMFRWDRLKKYYDVLEPPELDADYVTAYLNDTHFPTVIIQKGNTVVKALFYQTSSDYKMPLEEWASVICGSIGQ